MQQLSYDKLKEKATGRDHLLLTLGTKNSPLSINLNPILKNVGCAGNREYDTDYVKPILASDINYYDLQQLRTTGTDVCAKAFMQMIGDKNLDGFFIHLDVDVLNDAIMPAVDSRTPDGLWYPELNTLLQTLLAHPKARGLEITILDPDLDPDGKYTTEFVKNIGKVISDAGKEAAG